MMVYYIMFIQEIKDIIIDSKESPKLRDPRNRSTCKIEKTRTDHARSKLTNQSLEFISSSENQTRQLLNGSYGPQQETNECAILQTGDTKIRFVL